MLKHLTITNLAVINHLQVEFGDGLNILSGETGAGKSVILMALGLLLGERSSQDMLRTGESRAAVEGVFEVEGNAPLKELLQNCGIESDNVELIVRREISANGRGKIFVNNQAATLNLLKSIQPHIIDVHGQGEQQSLLATSTQTFMLDAYGKAEDQRRKVEQQYEQVITQVRELRAIKQSEADRLQQLDLLEFQIQEIQSLAPVANEDIELESERLLLANAEKLTSLCSDVLRSLYDSDDSVFAQIGFSERRLDDLAMIDSALTQCSENLSSAKYAIEDIAFTIRNYADKITYSPQRLQEIEERLSQLERIKRKYAKSLQEIIAQLKALKAKQEALRNSEAREVEVVEALRADIVKYVELAKRLTDLRKKAANELSKKLKKDLSEVALEKSQFIVYFNSPGASDENSFIRQLFVKETSGLVVNKSGEEIAEYYFSANQGEEARPLSSVASGGELSRLMLILKTNIAPTPYPRTLVFDEIDTGIGGRVADAVGVRLKKLSNSNQVICVTHQAQIARYADVHLQVAKIMQNGRTLTTVNKLDQVGKIEEIARMMAGSGVTTLTRQHAEELLVMQ